MSIRWQQEEAQELVVVCLPEPHSSRLAREIERTGARAVVRPAFTPVPGAVRYVVMAGEEAEKAVRAARGARIGVVGAEPGEVYDGAELLSGPLPGAVLDWLSDDEGGPRIAWEDAPRERSSGATRAARGLTLAVFSSGGGVGKTTAAVHLSAVASRAAETLLVELDEDRRGVLTWFDRRPKEGLDSLSPAEWGDAERFEEAMRRVAVQARYRLTVVPMVGTKFGMQYQVGDQDHLGTLYDWAERRAEVVVYDLPARVRDHVVLTTLSRADRVLIVVEPTKVMVESTLGYLDLLNSIPGVGQGIIRKACLLVNKTPARGRVGVPPREMAEALGLPLAGTVTLEPERYLAAINRHQVNLDDQWTELASYLGIPVEEDGGVRVRRQRRHGLFGFLRRR
jgi:cellulose biosynthesis protein BcsQ